MFLECKTFDRDMLILLHDVARMQRTRFDQWARNYGMTRAQGIILLRLERQPGLSQNEWRRSARSSRSRSAAWWTAWRREG